MDKTSRLCLLYRQCSEQTYHLQASMCDRQVLQRGRSAPNLHEGESEERMKRIADQVLILEAIGQVRTELREDMSFKDMMDVMTRLATLYSLLNVHQLRDIAVDADMRDINERKVA